MKKQIKKEEEEQLLREGIERLQKRFGQQEIEKHLSFKNHDVRSSARSSARMESRASLNEDIIS